MIIVSQDERTILNFDNLTTVRMYKTSTSCGIEACLINKNIADLGEYLTEERAKEVLEDIIDKYEDIQILKYSRESFTTRDNFVYRMPKE